MSPTNVTTEQQKQVQTVTIVKQSSLRLENYNLLNSQDPLVKIISYNQGNALKDCRAILQSMKQQFAEEQQKNYLFYQPNPEEMLGTIKVQLKQSNKSNKKQEIQIKMKLPKHQNIGCYNRLLKHSLKQQQKSCFQKQAARNKAYYMSNMKTNLQVIENPQTKNKHRRQKSNMCNLSTVSEKVQYLSQFQQVVQRKKNQLIISASNKQKVQTEKIFYLTKNRQVCQKMLEQALMFQRYYDILNKQKIAKSKNHIKTLQNETNLQIKTKSKGHFMNRNFRSKMNSINQKTSNEFNGNITNPNPKHLRLLRRDNQGRSQIKFNRQKYIQSQKKEQYFRQINKISQEIVEKKNFKNNLLIKNLLNMMRNNSDQQAINNQFSRISLSQALQKLFLIYSSKQSQDIDKAVFSVIKKQNILKFLNDFEISCKQFSDSIQFLQTINMCEIDQFKFVSFIHIIASHKMSKSQNKDQFVRSTNIYTNIHEFIYQFLVKPKQYQCYNYIQEHLILINTIPISQIIRLSTLLKLRKKLVSSLNLFIYQMAPNKYSQNQQLTQQNHKNRKIIKQKGQQINSTQGQKLMNFQYLLQILWSIKLYPNFINKKTVRFYFKYLQLQCGQLLKTHKSIITKLGGLQTKVQDQRNPIMILQNIVLLIISKLTIQQSQSFFKQSQVNYSNQYTKQNSQYTKQNSHNQNKNQQQQQAIKSREHIINQTFQQKFKIVIKAISSFC